MRTYMKDYNKKNIKEKKELSDEEKIKKREYMRQYMQNYKKK